MLQVFVEGWIKILHIRVQQVDVLGLFMVLTLTQMIHQFVVRLYMLGYLQLKMVDKSQSEFDRAKLLILERHAMA